jgi:hypothetical protein
MAYNAVGHQRRKVRSLKTLAKVLRLLSIPFFIFGVIEIFTASAAIGAGGYPSLYGGKMNLGFILNSVGAALLVIASWLAKRP